MMGEVTDSFIPRVISTLIIAFRSVGLTITSPNRAVFSRSGFLVLVFAIGMFRAVFARSLKPVLRALARQSCNKSGRHFWKGSVSVHWLGKKLNTVAARGAYLCLVDWVYEQFQKEKKKY